MRSGVVSLESEASREQPPAGLGGRFPPEGVDPPERARRRGKGRRRGPRPHREGGVQRGRRGLRRDHARLRPAAARDGPSGAARRPGGRRRRPGRLHLRVPGLARIPRRRRARHVAASHHVHDVRPVPASRGPPGAVRGARDLARRDTGWPTMPTRSATGRGSARRWASCPQSSASWCFSWIVTATTTVQRPGCWASHGGPWLTAQRRPDAPPRDAWAR